MMHKQSVEQWKDLKRLYVDIYAFSKVKKL